MPCRTLSYPSPHNWEHINSWLQGRAGQDQTADSVAARVSEILRQVQARGDEALVEYTRKFDCPDFNASWLQVPQDALRKAAVSVPAEDLAVIEEAAANIRSYHQAQVQHSWWHTAADGTVLGRLVRPVDRAGLYVPGGQGGETPLISSLLMNAVPAQVAGVEELALVSPPRKDGSLNPYLLAAAHLLGIEKVFCIGSAWAVAALAFGTATVPRVDVIAGPGNIYVTMAKQQLIGRVGIDMIAGPSEIVILADQAGLDAHNAPASWLAADMLSQAEHDPLASSLLITTDSGLADDVRRELSRQLDDLPRNTIARQALEDWSAVILTPDLAAGMELVNHIAPEHLELVVPDPWRLLGSVRHAGAIFCGASTPEPVGDYFAGPNHVLPTMGTARFSSGLSVETFCKKSSLIAATPGYVAAHGEKIARLARLEGLEAHARSVTCRRHNRQHASPSGE